MRLLKSLILAGILASSGFVSAALADKRVALVIGNSNYLQVKALPNPTRDAAAVAALLRGAGFDSVEVQENLANADMKRVIRDFFDRTRDSDVAVLYYAGHGMEVDGVNYLLPVDAALKRDIDVEDEAVSLDRVLKILEPARRLRLVILDACRDNPFTQSMRRTVASRSIGRGLARIEPTVTDTLIAFAAKAGSTADDGNGLHSPFTSALLKNLQTPGLDLRIAFGRVRDDVLAATNHRQEPFVYGSLGGQTVSLFPVEATKPAEPVASPVAAPKPAPVPVDTEAVARRDYELAAQVGTKDAWDSFLAVHTAGFYADLARAQRAKLLAQNVKPMPTTANTPTVAAPPVTAPKPLAPGPRLSSVQPQQQQPAAQPSSTSPGQTRVVVTDPLVTVRDIHVELKRLGCYRGDLDSPWDETSRRALEAFNRHAGTRLDGRVASLDLLDVLRTKPAGLCPLECNRGYRAQGDTCVKITCKRGYEVNDNGDCVRQHRTNTASRPPKANVHEPKREPRSRATTDSPGQRVVCGQNGCLPVKKGCRGEIRPSGHDQVAVVNCH